MASYRRRGSPGQSEHLSFCLEGLTEPKWGRVFLNSFLRQSLGWTIEAVEHLLVMYEHVKQTKIHADLQLGSPVGL